MDMNLEQLQKTMEASEADSMTFMVRREHPEPGRTFSAEALDSIETQIRLFIGSRIVHSFERPEFKQRGHENIQVAVRVEIDGQHAEPLDAEYPWYGTIDGASRKEALS